MLNVDSQLNVSVILTVLNEEKTIGSLLDMLLQQQFPPDEIAIVDGGSTDGTVNILRQYAVRDSRIHFWVKDGVNISKGRNIAIKKSKGDILAVTDGGCRVQETWLAELIAPILESKDIDAVSGMIRIDAHTVFERFAGLLSTSIDPGDDDSRLFFGRSSAFTRHLWETVGGYPEWLYTGEDTLFAIKAKSDGFKVSYAPKSVLLWRPRTTWAKLAKQYYLYGKGTGRIGLTKVKASFYHVRNHVLWMAFCLVGFGFWPFFFLSGAVLVRIYYDVVCPELKRNNDAAQIPMAQVYIPAIVMLRNLFNNLGQLVGAFELRFRPSFRHNLNLYMSGNKFSKTTICK